MWHARTQGGVHLSAELGALDARQYELDFKLRDAATRQKYSSDPAAVTKATADLTSVLVEMDRLMTRVRAVEAKLILLRKRERQSAAQPPCLSAECGMAGMTSVPGDLPGRVAVEVHRTRKNAKHDEVVG